MLAFIVDACVVLVVLLCALIALYASTLRPVWFTQVALIALCVLITLMRCRKGERLQINANHRERGKTV